MADGRAVTIVDVFPRDGLQTLLHEEHLRMPSTEEKVAVIQALDEAGVPEIEVTGFVHPKVIPSLADAEAVSSAALKTCRHARLRALVPNLRGAERALAVGLKRLSGLIIVSETYQRLNSNMTVERNLQAIAEIARAAEAAGAELHVGMGTCFVCPYEGVVAEEQLTALVDRFYDMGIREFSLADSIGLAWPMLVRARLDHLREKFPDATFALHLHTLAGTAIANAYAGYEAGVRVFEGSVGGIGGGIAMPVHTTDMGNVASEDLVYLFESAGLPTGIDLERLASIGRHTKQMIGTGGGRVTDFGTLDGFLRLSRRGLDRVAAAPPGDSSNKR